MLLKKRICLFALAVLISIPGPLLAQGEGYDYKTLVDIVYEASPQGHLMVQLGSHYTISQVNTLLLYGGENDDHGKPVLHRVPRRYLKIGKPAKAFLKEQDENGFWIADRLIVFSGAGLEWAKDRLSPGKRKELADWGER